MDREFESALEQLRVAARDPSLSRKERRRNRELVRYFDEYFWTTSPYHNRFRWAIVGMFGGSVVADLLGSESWVGPIGGLALGYLMACILDLYSSMEAQDNLERSGHLLATPHPSFRRTGSTIRNAHFLHIIAQHKLIRVRAQADRINVV